MRSRALGGVAALTLMLTLSVACVPPPDPGGPPGSGGKVVIGVKFDQPALGLKDGDTYTGFDIDVARYVAKKLGYTDVQFVEARTGKRTTMLQSNQVKMVVASYSITDARKELISFAGPYLVVGQDLLIRANEETVTGPESMSHRKLCSVVGSTSAEMVRDMYAPTAQLREYDTYSQCIQALEDGVVQAVTTDNVILAGYAAQPQYRGHFKLVGRPFTTERYGIGIRQGDPDLCAKISSALTDMVADGTWRKSVEATIGTTGFLLDSATNPPKTDPCS
jgi:glutamate transport system substrate-binding protein